MRTFIAYLAGIATAYAALAIWQRVPPLPDFEPETPVLSDRLRQSIEERGRA